VGLGTAAPLRPAGKEERLHWVEPRHAMASVLES
jgi:hypothetical protein